MKKLFRNLLNFLWIFLVAFQVGCAPVDVVVTEATTQVQTLSENNSETAVETQTDLAEAVVFGQAYTTKEDVALYLYIYGELPENFITKKEARNLGWEAGGLDEYQYGACIGGDKFGNYEGNLPVATGRQYYECDIDTMNETKRGAKRIVYSNDGLIYYTEDHYNSFELLYEGAAIKQKGENK